MSRSATALLSRDAARLRHVGNDPDIHRYDPDLWKDEFAFLSSPGQDDIHGDLFYDPRWKSLMRVIVVALFGLCISSPLAAQRRFAEPAGVVRRAISTTTERLQPSQDAGADAGRVPPFIPRALLGTAGAVGGALAGAYLGIAILGRDCGGCDDPGLGQALTGAAIGAVVGGAAVGAIPQLGSRCSYASRFGRGLIGSAVGGILGGVASGGSGLILVTFPVGIGSGTALASNTC